MNSGEVAASNAPVGIFSGGIEQAQARVVLWLGRLPAK
jgi:hypothetical protein